MRTLVASVLVAGLLLGGGSGPATAGAVSSVEALEPMEDAPWPATLEQERQLVAFQEAAMAAGALGFYRKESSETLVVVVSSTLKGQIDFSSLNAPVPLTVEASPLDASTVEDIGVAFGKLTEGFSGKSDSLAFFFDAELGLVRVITTVEPKAVADALGGLWQFVHYQYGGVRDAGRFDDSAPFYGGAALDVVDWKFPDYDCTAGFTVVNGSGKRGLVTAAHCGNTVQKTMRTPAGTFVGAIENRHCPDEGVDVELVAGGQNYENWIYTGTTKAGIAREVTDAGTPAVGSTYRFSGATSYEKTNQKVVSVTGSYTSNACEIVHLLSPVLIWQRERTYDETCDVRGGDSGGPFYVQFAGTPPTVQIRGMVTAGNDIFCFGMLYSRISSKLGYTILKT